MPWKKIPFADEIDGGGGGGGDACLVVAASDAPSDLKNRADYVCDGSDDQVEINNALSNAKKVILTVGTFHLSGDITIPSYTTLFGSGWGTLVSGSSIRNSDQDDGNTHVEVGFLRKSGAPSMGAVRMENVSFFKVHDILIEGNNGQRGIFIRKATDGWVERNYIKDVNYAGISCERATQDTPDVFRIAIKDNILNHAQLPIYIECSDDIIIESNRCFGEPTQGALLQGSHNIIIKGNDFGATADYAVLSIESDGTRRCRNIKIIGNEIHDGGSTEGYGIRIYGSGHKYITIANNHIYNNQMSGIYLYAGEYISIIGNHFYDDQTTKTQDYGIEFRNADAFSNILLKNNVIGEMEQGKIHIPSSVSRDAILGEQMIVNVRDTSTIGFALPIIIPKECVLLKASIVAQSDVPSSSSDYYTFTLKDKGGDGSAEDVICSKSTNGNPITAFDEWDLGSLDSTHKVLNRGDVLNLHIDKTGSPPSLDAMSLLLKFATTE